MSRAADDAVTRLKKMRLSTEVKWVYYSLIVLFALNAIGFFQVLLGGAWTGLTFNAFSLELGSAIVFSLLLYLWYESNRHAGKLEGRLANLSKLEGRLAHLTTGLEATIAGLGKTMGERASDTGSRITGLEARATRIEGGIGNLERAMSRIDNGMSGISNRVDALDTKASTIGNNLANAHRILSKIGETQSQMGERVGGLEVTVPRVTRMETGLSKIERDLARIDGKVASVAKSQGALSKLEKSVSSIEGRVGAIAKMQGRGSVTPHRKREQIPSLQRVNIHRGVLETEEAERAQPESVSAGAKSLTEDIAVTPNPTTSLSLGNGVLEHDSDGA